MKQLPRVLAASSGVVSGTLALLAAFFATMAGVSPGVRAAEDITPFPPGEGAAVARQVCTHCHGANLIISKHYDRESAERYWRTMVGPDLGTAQARTVITYLMTAMGGDDNDGPDAAVH